MNVQKIISTCTISPVVKINILSCCFNLRFRHNSLKEQIINVKYRNKVVFCYTVLKGMFEDKNLFLKNGRKTE